MKYLLSIVVAVSMMCALAVTAVAQVTEEPVPVPDPVESQYIVTTEILANALDEMEYGEAIEIVNASDRSILLRDISLVSGDYTIQPKIWPAEIPCGRLYIGDTLKPGQRGVILTPKGARALADSLTNPETLAIYGGEVLFEKLGILNKGMQWDVLLGGKVIDTVTAYNSTQFEGISQQVVFDEDGRAIDFFSAIEDAPQSLSWDVNEVYSLDMILDTAYYFLKAPLDELLSIGLEDEDANLLLKYRPVYKDLIDAQMLNSLQVSGLIFAAAAGQQMVDLDVMVTPKKLKVGSEGVAKLTAFLPDDVVAQECDLDSAHIMDAIYPAHVATGSGNNAVAFKIDRAIIFKYKGVVSFDIMCGDMTYGGVGEWDLQ